MSHQSHSHSHDYISDDLKIKTNEKKTLIVIALTFVTMIAEIYFGYFTNSMSLLADGWHMASHAGALGITFLAYRLARSSKFSQKLTFGSGKFIPLGGYTSAISLGIVAVIMAFESTVRMLNPVAIKFDEAIYVAILGLIVNLASAFILTDHHGHSHGHDHDHDHTHDHNLKSALAHVIADALTSVSAIIALLIGKHYQMYWADPLMGIVSSLVILRWAYLLCKETVWELLDGESKQIDKNVLKEIFRDDKNVEITDLHLWRIAPKAHACEMMVYCNDPKGTEYYRDKILERFSIEHLIIEERQCIH